MLKIPYLLTVLLVLFLLSIRIVYAQKPLAIAPPSANAASLGQYGQVPVSLYTGKPTIEVPLYTVKSGDLTVPISLSYYAAGVKIQDPVGWTGLNWTLNAGGAITRVIRGKRDENINYGYFYMGGALGRSNSWTWEDISSEFKSSNYYGLRAAADGEPDIFYFNFANYSGKFYKGHDQKFHVIPYQNFKIECDYPGRIVITTEDGTVYSFGSPNGSRDAVELTYAGPLEDYADIPITAYLKRVTSATGEVIDFTYASTDDRGRLYQWRSAQYLTQYDAALSRWNGSMWVLNESCFSSVSNREVITAVYKTYLESITTKRETIRLSRSDANDTPYYTDPFNSTSVNYDNQKLTSIEITDRASAQLHKRFVFSYLEQNRLMLQAVQEEGTQGAVVPPYRFEYDMRALPNYRSTQMDHWGFYNAFTPAPATLLPSRTGNTHGPERDPNPSVATVGLLTYLHYPTGGYTKFEYQSHDYSKVLERDPNDLKTSVVTSGAVQTAGGVRIWKVTNHDGLDASKNTVKEYKYVQNYTPGTNTPSSGVLGGKPIYYYSYTTSTDGGSVTNSYKIGYATAVSIAPLSYTEGSHIGYSEVTELRSDGSYTVHKFTNFDNRLDRPATITNYSGDFVQYAPVNSMELERGKPLFTGVYNSAGAPLSTKEYVYNDDPTRFTQSVRAVADLDPVPSCVFSFYINVGYELYTYPYYLKQEIEKVYDQNDPTKFTTTITDYRYNGLNQLAEVSKSMPGDNTINISRTKYVGDYTITGTPTDPTALALSQMKTRNILSPVVEAQQWVKVGAQDQLKSATLYKYRNFTTGGLQPFQALALRLDNAITGYAGASVDANNNFVHDSRFEPRVSFVAYNAQGKLHQQQKQDDVPTTYLWGYQSTYLIAEIKNATYEAVRDALGGQAVVDALANSATLSASQLTQLNNLRQHASLRQALVTTFTYAPVVGLTSQTDANNVTTYFEYDGLGRMIYQKDQDGHITQHYQYHYKIK